MSTRPAPPALPDLVFPNGLIVTFTYAPGVDERFHHAAHTYWATKGQPNVSGMVKFSHPAKKALDGFVHSPVVTVPAVAAAVGVDATVGGALCAECGGPLRLPSRARIPEVASKLAFPCALCDPRTGALVAELRDSARRKHHPVFDGWAAKASARADKVYSAARLSSGFVKAVRMSVLLKIVEAGYGWRELESEAKLDLSTTLALANAVDQIARKDLLGEKVAQALAAPRSLDPPVRAVARLVDAHVIRPVIAAPGGLLGRGTQQPVCEPFLGLQVDHFAEDALSFVIAPVVDCLATSRYRMPQEQTLREEIFALVDARLEQLCAQRRDLALKVLQQARDEVLDVGLGPAAAVGAGSGAAAASGHRQHLRGPAAHATSGDARLRWLTAVDDSVRNCVATDPEAAPLRELIEEADELILQEVYQHLSRALARQLLYPLPAEGLELLARWVVDRVKASGESILLPQLIDLITSVVHGFALTAREEMATLIDGPLDSAYKDYFEMQSLARCDIQLKAQLSDSAQVHAEAVATTPYLVQYLPMGWGNTDVASALLRLRDRVGTAVVRDYCVPAYKPAQQRQGAATVPRPSQEGYTTLWEPGVSASSESQTSSEGTTIAEHLVLGNNTFLDVTALVGALDDALGHGELEDVSYSRAAEMEYLPATMALARAVGLGSPSFLPLDFLACAMLSHLIARYDKPRHAGGDGAVLTDADAPGAGTPRQRLSGAGLGGEGGPAGTVAGARTRPAGQLPVDGAPSGNGVAGGNDEIVSFEDGDLDEGDF